nr:MAG TPA: hypothetical protein [Caudoviricetes sp.]
MCLCIYIVFEKTVYKDSSCLLASLKNLPIAYIFTKEAKRGEKLRNLFFFLQRNRNHTSKKIFKNTRFYVLIRTLIESNKHQYRLFASIYI